MMDAKEKEMCCWPFGARVWRNRQVALGSYFSHFFCAPPPVWSPRVVMDGGMISCMARSQGLGSSARALAVDGRVRYCNILWVRSEGMHVPVVHGERAA